MAAPGITVVVSFQYRGHAEEWSNQYHLDSDFASLSDFNTTADDLRLALTDFLSPNVRFMRAYGYHDTDDSAAYTRDWSVGTPLYGAFTPGEFDNASPGDTAFMCRWKTARVNTHGHAIYLRKYFHDAFIDVTQGSADSLSSDQLAAANTFAAAAISAGWGGHIIAGPDGEVPTDGVALEFVTTRTLRRRGRRPTPP